MRPFPSAEPWLIGVWLTAVAAGLVVLLNYESKPGISGIPPVSWPATSKIKLSDKQATLVMVVHPHCPCTRASMEELDQLMAKEHGKLAAYVLFWNPKGVPTDWQKTDLWQSASAIPDVKVLTDQDGLEANQFHSSTSGQTMVYSKDGKLLFSGGITPGRAHVGDNIGVDTIESIMCNKSVQQKNSLVFGCSLLTPKSKTGTTSW